MTSRSGPSRRLLALAGGVLAFGTLAEVPPPAFRTDVMAVISKAGCNAGTCHGNASGKAGFKLSLRGQDPDLDYLALTREHGGRRINPLEPEESLVLLKPTTTLAHEGGQRFAKDSWEYQTLLRWIESGAQDDEEGASRPVRLEVTPGSRILFDPADEFQVRTKAVFDDGTTRDVSDQAVYESSGPNVEVTAAGKVRRQSFGETTVLVRYLGLQEPVRVAFVPERPGFRWSKPRPNNFIDDHVFAKLRSLRLNPSDSCSDEIFCRRLHLDLLGVLPTAKEARGFVEDRRRNKRVRLMERLLERPEFADHWALKWADLLRVEERTLDRKGMTVFHRWIRDSILQNKPMDQFARELIGARGSTYANPPANFYRANRTPTVRSEAVAQVFLGTRLQCAQCHNHPFDRWTQDDYYDWAAVFARIDTKVLRNDRRDDNDKHEFKGEQVVFLARHAEVKNPRLSQAARPRVLGESEPMVLEGEAGRETADAPPPAIADRSNGADELKILADWLTSPSNPLFARAQVNRIWYHLMGRGIVDPIDDFRATNPATHPELLEALADDFIRHRFDLRRMIRLIVNSKTYQAGSRPRDPKDSDEVNYAQAGIRRLTAEQLLDAQHQVCGVMPRLAGYPDGMRAGELPSAPTERRRGDRGGAGRFLELFGKPPRLLTCECERSTDTTLGQALALVSGPTLNDLLRSPDNRLGEWLESGQSDEAIVEELYWTALGRAPASEELARTVGWLSRASEKRVALEDVAWSVLNCKEFVLRR